MQSTRVLLIEDDEVFANLITRFLEQRGYKVTLALDGETGLRFFAADDPDVVLCDLKLPRMSGLDVLEKLLQECSQVPVIVVSASEQMSDIREAVRLGAWDYLVKPVQQLDSIDVAIQNCLTRSTLEDAWERERWELDDHIDVLFDNGAVTDQLIQDLIPNSDLQVGPYTIFHNLLEEENQGYWIDYHRLPDNQAVAIIAGAQAVAGQTLVSLLVLKTLFNPILRLASGGHDDGLRQPHRVLERINAELCHSKIKTAFSLGIVWLDGNTGTVHWSHAGDAVQFSSESKPDLSLGIWSHASYRLHQGQIKDNTKLSIRLDETELVIAHQFAVSAA